MILLVMNFSGILGQTSFRGWLVIIRKYANILLQQDGYIYTYKEFSRPIPVSSSCELLQTGLRDMFM